MRASSIFVAAAVAAGHVANARRCESKGTFANPGASRRAFFRYWFPDASVDAAMVAEDIASAAAVGAGGIEFVPFYEYAGEIGPPPPGVDWSTLGFGTEPFKERFRTALRAHADNGLLMDFALGPGMGHGVPASPDDEGLQWDLVASHIDVPADGWRKQILPGWGEGRLVALVSASVVSVSNESTPAPSNQFLAAPYDTYVKYILDASSLKDVTDSVSSDGQVSINGPLSGNVTLFAFYEKRSLHKALIFDNDRSETIFDNGSYVVDHYSARGARTVIGFWEEFLLEDDIEDLLKRVGQYGWEDSVEIKSNVSWSPGLLAAFESQHRYSLRPYLPLLMWQNNNLGLQREDPGRVRAVLDTADGGQGFINDFRTTLQLGYRAYITTLSLWLRERLGLGLRAQVSYNLPMEMGANIPFVDVPECESLGFKDSIDAYRLFSGPAALAGKRIVSNEMGAVFLKAYKHDIPLLVHQTDLAFAGGNNHMILHGMAFGGNYSGTTWPGHSAFNYFVSEMHSRKHPSWEAGMPEAMEYLARTQFVMQEGVARADVAVFHHASATDTLMPTLYRPTDLGTAGFSYLYVAPDNLGLDTATVKDGVLGPDTAGFRVLLLMPGAALSLQSARDVTKLAEQGLPILITGDTVVQPSADGANREDVLEAIEALKAQPSVHLVSNGTAAESLISLGINPFVATRSNGTWVTSRRRDACRGIDYVFLLGPSHATRGEITVASSGQPYLMDAWTGEIKPVLHYVRSAGGESLTIPLSLAPDQTLMLAFAKEPLDGISLPDAHITSMPPGVTGSHSEDGGLVLHVPAGLTPPLVELSTGETRRVNVPAAAEAFELTDWNLTVEHWEAPRDLNDVDTTATRRNTTHRLTAPLLPWTELAPGLHNASGVGLYTSSFEWDTSAADGAHLRFTTVLNAVRVFVNGRQAAAVDPRDPVVDMTGLLLQGQNEVLIVVPSLMWNYIRTLIPQLEMAGTPAFTTNQFTVQIPLPGPVSNGLVGSVVITPYRVVALGG